MLDRDVSCFDAVTTSPSLSCRIQVATRQRYSTRHNEEITADRSANEERFFRAIGHAANTRGIMPCGTCKGAS